MDDQRTRTYELAEADVAFLLLAVNLLSVTPETVDRFLEAGIPTVDALDRTRDRVLRRLTNPARPTGDPS
jgi:hypothetical protein